MSVLSMARNHPLGHSSHRNALALPLPGLQSCEEQLSAPARVESGSERGLCALVSPGNTARIQPQTIAEAAHGAFAAKANGR